MTQGKTPTCANSRDGDWAWKAIYGRAHDGEFLTRPRLGLFRHLTTLNCGTMRLKVYETLFIYGILLPAVMAAPFAQGIREDHSWSQFLLDIARALGMRGYKHSSSFAVDLGMPQAGDNWLWNLNGWTLAESELSVVVCSVSA